MTEPSEASEVTRAAAEKCFDAVKRWAVDSSAEVELSQKQFEEITNSATADLQRENAELQKRLAEAAAIIETAMRRR